MFYVKLNTCYICINTNMLFNSVKFNNIKDLIPYNNVIVVLNNQIKDNYIKIFLGKNKGYFISNEEWSPEIPFENVERYLKLKCFL